MYYNKAAAAADGLTICRPSLDMFGWAGDERDDGNWEIVLVATLFYCSLLSPALQLSLCDVVGRWGNDRPFSRTEKDNSFGRCVGRAM